MACTESGRRLVVWCALVLWQVVERVEISDDEDDGFEYKYAEIDEALLKEVDHFFAS